MLLEMFASCVLIATQKWYVVEKNHIINISNEPLKLMGSAEKNVIIL
jgi:hypothetical protein